MSTHLSPQEFVEVIDGALPPARFDHLSECDACRREADDLRALMTDVEGAGSVPEPTPLYWDHLSQRVMAVTSDEPTPVPTSWWMRPISALATRNWRPLVAVSTLAAVAVLAVLLRPASRPALSPAPANVVAAVDDGEFDLAPDESFEFVTQLASVLSWDDLNDVARPSADATAAVIDRLTPAQQAEFIRLLKLEVGGVE